MIASRRQNIAFLITYILGIIHISVGLAQPSLNLDHLRHLTRNCTVGGSKSAAVQIYAEHPDYRWVGDSDEGDMCVDDAARALVLYCRQLPSDSSATNVQAIRQLTTFITSMQAENGFFYNFIFADGTINREHQNSRAEASFWSWRAFWALSEVLLADSGLLMEEKKAARESIESLLPHLSDICKHPLEMEISHGMIVPVCLARLGGDQAGILLTALCNFVKSNPENSNQAYIGLIRNIGDALLLTQYGSAHELPCFAFMSWKHIWHAWGNIQAYALMNASDQTGDEKYRIAALKEVSHFYTFIVKNGYMESFSLMGLPENKYIVESIQSFPQIAYGIRPMVFASVEAYRHTKDKNHLQTALDLASWLFGKNPAGKVMYDKNSGRVFDGIQSSKNVNLNCGAESTIEGLLAIQKLATIPEGKKWLKEISETPFKNH